MHLEQDTGELDRTKIGRFVRDNWLLAVAIHPLLRVLILAEPPAESNAVQLAERFQWLSCWVLELAIVVVAIRDGFRVVPFIRNFHPKTKWLVAIWLAVLAIATFRAEYVELSIRSAFEWLMHGIFFLALWHLAARDHARFMHLFDRFARLLPWMTALAGLVVMGLVYSIGLSSDYPFGTDIPGFSHIRHSGYIFAPAMALCLCRLATAPAASRVPMVLLALNVALCLWFGSRGPFVGLIAGLATACVLFPEFRRPVFWLRSLVAGVAGAILSVVIPSPEYQAFNAIRRFLDGSVDPSEFSSGRTELWKDAARLILDRPLLGYGGGQFQFASRAARNMYRHPHDFILQVTFDWGVLGGGAFLCMLVLAWLIILKVRKGGNFVSKAGCVGTASMLGFALLDGILFYPYPIAITLVFLVAALSPTMEPYSRLASVMRASELRLRTSG